MARLAVVFDSHSRDSEGMFDSCGTFVLVEMASLDKLVEYFEDLYVGIIGMALFLVRPPRSVNLFPIETKLFLALGRLNVNRDF